MSDDEHPNIQTETDEESLIDLEHHEDQTVTTASMTGEPGYIAWVEDEYDRVRATGETRWEAIYHLAVAKAGEER